MGFAEEVKASQDKGPAAAAVSGENIFNNGLNKEVVTTVDAKPIEQEKPTEKTKIKIGAKYFDNQEDALSYAQELELKHAQTEAYLKGVQESQPKVDTPKIRTLEEEISEQLFEKPEEALAKYKKAIMDEMRKSQKEEQALIASVTSTWNKFYTDNPDLSGMEELVEYVADKNKADIGELPLDKGLKELAARTRSVIKKLRKDSLPEQELPPGKAVVTTPGGENMQKATTKPLQTVDFIQQVNKLRKRGAKQIE